VSTIIDKALKGEKFEDDGFRLAPLVDEYLESLNGRPNTRKLGVYHPSAIDGCARKLYYCRIGKEPARHVEPKLRRIFDMGHSVHNMINQYLVDMYGVEDVGIEVKLGLDVLHIRGEADVVFPPGTALVANGRVIDLKTINDAGFSRLKEPTFLPNGDVEPKSMRTYVWQGHCYMASLDIPLFTLFYINKNNCEIAEFSFPFNLKTWWQIEEKLLRIEESVESGVPPEREINKWKCRGCDYFHLCKPPGVSR
jgi:hypothetical protein